MIKNFFRYIYYEIISIFIFFNLRSENGHSYQVFFLNNKNLFNKLCIKYGTDKGFNSFGIKKFFGKGRNNFDYCYPHSYSKFYNDQFFDNRKKIKLIFECGIGDKTNKKKFIPGASLKVWRDFFPNAKIYGGDINEKLLFNSKKITTFHLDQKNSSNISRMWKRLNKKNFDVIIDDGAHNFNANINFFKNSFKQVKKGGVYIIEDILIQNLNPYKKYFKMKRLKFEIIHFNNNNYSNHCLIKIVK